MLRTFQALPITMLKPGVGFCAPDQAVKVAILAGGLGTRLGALTRGLPKPMITVSGPFQGELLETRAFYADVLRETIPQLIEHLPAEEPETK